MQETLSADQIATFYHDEFVEDQTRHFVSLVGSIGAEEGVVLDVGGGCGFFARRLASLVGRRVRVMDTDDGSVDTCRRAGVEAIRGDALSPPVQGDEVIVTFNLILHHLVGASEAATQILQRQALELWRPRVLSWFGRIVASVVPALRANTFGVGVRFRSHDEWKRLFESAGYSVTATAIGEAEYVSSPRRLLMIKQIRRDSFRLEPA